LYLSRLASSGLSIGLLLCGFISLYLFRFVSLCDGIVEGNLIGCFSLYSCLQAALQYLFLTLAALHGGHYLVGFWLTLSASILTGLLCISQYFLNAQYYRSPEYHRISYQTTGGQFVDPSLTYPPPTRQPGNVATPSLVSPIPRVLAGKGGYGAVGEGGDTINV